MALEQRIGNEVDQESIALSGHPASIRGDGEGTVVSRSSQVLVRLSRVGGRELPHAAIGIENGGNAAVERRGNVEGVTPAKSEGALVVALIEDLQTVFIELETQ